MNFREAGIYTDRSTIELKTEFEIILEAMNAIGQKNDITVELLNFWLYGSIPTNYSIYMSLLDGESLLKKAGVPTEYIHNALMENTATDKYLLFKNACLNFIGEELTSDFKPLVLNPLFKMFVKPSTKDKDERVQQLSDARATIKAMSGTISKTITTLEKMKPHYIAGTDVESILIKLKQTEHTIINQIATS